MVLTGGGGMLKDLDRLLMEETGLPVIIAEEPLTCVARGGGRALEMVDKIGDARTGFPRRTAPACPTGLPTCSITQ